MKKTNFIWDYVHAIFLTPPNSGAFKELKGRSGIYAWYHLPSGKFYIGSAQDLYIRLQSYFQPGWFKKNPNSIIGKAISRDGHQKFALLLLQFCDPSNLIKFEQGYFDHLKPLYNILPIAGSSRGTKLSNETKEKIRAVALLRTGPHPKAQIVNILDLKTGVQTQVASIRKVAELLGSDIKSISRVIDTGKPYRYIYLITRHKESD